MIHQHLCTLLVSTLLTNIGAFTIHNPNIHARRQSTFQSFSPSTIKTKHSRLSRSTRLYQNTIHKVPEDDDTTIPFLDPQDNTFIECYADSIAIVNGVEYTIGNPCDTTVALCYFDPTDNLIPIELDSEMMDSVFPQAASIVEEEFGEELVLERTPQTLTLVGELEEGEDDDDDDEEFDEEDDVSDEDEEVEILLSYENDGVEYVLVRLLDPVLLVGKAASQEDSDNKCILLTPSESDVIMPILEDLFLEYQEERDSMAS
mmetsp:Transcript_21113/g.30918  ORF Transcript_21113/g.30918 Transcript_21113/m.30918 type:complete len:260 (-) Transcript_21113:200-979(-)